MSTSTAAAHLTAADLREAYARMLRIRHFEQRVSRLYASGEIPGFVHVSIGQEASAVGACWPLRDGDVITSTHRGHGHCLARGLDVRSMMAELMARQTGTNRGFGGSMHIADPIRGVFGANGIVAGGLPIATGAAAAFDLRAEPGVVVAFLGDGAVAQGAFHEAVNLAALWRLPLVIYCENNGYAEFSAAGSQHPVSLEQRAAGYGLPYTRVDGNDVEAVATMMMQVVDEVRAGGGPHFVESVTYRWHGHYEGDPERYRDAEEVAAWREGRDPVRIAHDRLLELGVPVTELEGLATGVEQELEDAVGAAREAPQPNEDDLQRALLAPRPSHSVEPAVAGDDEFRVMDGIRWALEEELASDPAVFLAGIDVGAAGNVFGLTRGLHDRWPDRVRDTPIAETAIVGLGVGAAMAGMRPVVEIMYLDFIGVCFDQILNQAAKLRWMTGGGARMALTIRTQFGAGRSSGSQHSQSLEAMLAHVPGLAVVMPSTPADTYGLLRAAIQDPNPVVVIENRLLYGRKGPRPPRGHVVPIGRAVHRRHGSDVTLVSYSRMAHTALQAAEQLAGEGIDVEVIDLRTIAPWDAEMVCASVRRTSRLVVAHEAVSDFGVGAEIAARVADECIWWLDAPVRRVGAAPTPAPYAPDLEARWLPDQARIVDTVREVVRS